MDHLVATYGYWAVFGVVALESVGIPLPGETALVAAAIYAGHTHKLSIWLIFVVAAAGAILGDNLGFWIGDKGGYPLLRKYGRYLRLDTPKIKVGRYVFDRYGGSVVFFGRFVSVLRTYAAFLAGTNRMPWRRFLVFNAAGGVAWSALYAFGAYAIGSSFRHLSGTLNLIFAAVAVVVLVVVLLLVRRKSGQLEARAEAAYPGPLPGEHRTPARRG